MAWDEILGQDFAKRLLQAQLGAGNIPNASLLVGPDGVGKRRLAFEMAKALNCEAAQRPCDQCVTCRQIGGGVHPDLRLLVPGGPSDQIRIDEIRALVGRVMLRPYSASVQVAIIDGAERLTEEAANSLLKVLEEPPERARFLLTTARLSRCLPTIVSRCQLIRCHPLSPAVIEQILIRQASCDARTAGIIARLAAGSASRALELAGRWASHEQAVARLAARETTAWFEQPLPETRDEVAELLDDMTAWLRDVVVAAVGDPSRAAHADRAEALQRQARAVEVDRCLDVASKLLALRESMEQFVSPRLLASLAREAWLSLHEGKT